MKKNYPLLNMDPVLSHSSTFPTITQRDPEILLYLKYFEIKVNLEFQFLRSLDALGKIPKSR